MNNKILPKSNHSPCECQTTSGDRINGIPDRVLRPARKEINVASIGSKMKVDNNGYKVVKPAPDVEPVGTGKPKKKKYVEEDDDGDMS